MPTFAYRLLPPRQNFVPTLTTEEAATMARHLEHLLDLKAKGIARYAGRTASGNYGFVVIEAGSEGEAYVLARSDPAVAEGVMRMEVDPFLVVFDGSVAA